MDETKIFGFWVYLMTDLVIFAVLFTTFVVLRTSTFGGPTGRELYEMPTIIAETLILLISSFTCSLATLAVHREQKSWVIFWFFLTFILGVSFLALELREFSQFIEIGAGLAAERILFRIFYLGRNAWTPYLRRIIVDGLCHAPSLFSAA